LKGLESEKDYIITTLLTHVQRIRNTHTDREQNLNNSFIILKPEVGVESCDS